MGASLEEALVTRYAMCAECQLIARNPTLFQPDGDPVTGVKLETLSSSNHLKATMNTDLFEADYPDNKGRPKSGAPFFVEIFTSSSGEVDNHQNCGAGGAKRKLSRLRVACVPGMPIYRGLREDESIGEDVRTLWPGPGGRLSEYLGCLRELDLSGSLISKWTEVANVSY